MYCAAMPIARCVVLSADCVLLRMCTSDSMLADLACLLEPMVLDSLSAAADSSWFLPRFMMLCPAIELLEEYGWMLVLTNNSWLSRRFATVETSMTSSEAAGKQLEDGTIDVSTSQLCCRVKSTVD